MLSLQIDAPLGFVVELLAAVLKQLDGVCIRAADEGMGKDIFKAGSQTFIHKAVEEVDLILCIVKKVSDHIFEHVFFQLADIR